jgi:hypothetical protein
MAWGRLLAFVLWGTPITEETVYVEKVQIVLVGGLITMGPWIHFTRSLVEDMTSMEGLYTRSPRKRMNPACSQALRSFYQAFKDDQMLYGWRL